MNVRYSDPHCMLNKNQILTFSTLCARSLVLFLTLFEDEFLRLASKLVRASEDRGFKCTSTLKSEKRVSVLKQGMSSLRLMVSHKKAYSFKGQALFPGAHLCNGMAAVTTCTYTCLE